jgi:tRNA A-37 threonylcarbamoyl transferase component Bud32
VEGTSFGRYQLIELLGRGGMGEVWRAHDTAIDRVVALKMLLPRYAQDPEFDKRFRREARAVARLDDPHVVPIYDVGEIDGRLYVTMRLINGVDLQTLLDGGPLEPDRAVYVIEQVASALHSAHQAGLVHRDVKPSNILLTHNDFAYLIDFGIAHAVGETALTSANTTIGTWAYMAPERFRTGEAEPSSDVYALACVFYQCLTGHPPFPGDALEQIAVGHMVAPPPRPSEERDTVPTAMDQVIATGLAKRPTDRYPSAVEMAAAARRAVTDPSGGFDAAPTQLAPVISNPGALAWSDPAYAGQWETDGADPGWPAPSPAPPTAGRRWRPAVVIGALAAVTLLIAGGVFAILKFAGGGGPGATSASGTATAGGTAAAAPNTGPFTGRYRADFGPITSLDGVGDPNAPPSTATYGVRSLCRPTGCVATAARLSGDASFAPTLDFDEVGGTWLSVAIASQQCRDDAGAETWQVFRLQSGANATLTGEHTAMAGNSCEAKHTVTFTRTGDVDINSLPDPANLPPRVVSPAEALYGAYQQARTFTNGQKQQTAFVVATDCLRTGDRCISYFHESTGLVEPLVFADGQWTLATEINTKCSSTSDQMLVKKSAQYPLPQPQENPITLLTGHGHQEQTQPCAANVEFDETFTRTGG